MLFKCTEHPLKCVFSLLSENYALELNDLSLD